VRAFSGVSYHRLDAKNHLFIPQRFRDAGVSSYTLTSGIDNCVVMYSRPRWDEVVKRIEALSLRNKAYQRAFVRTFFADAEEVTLDRQGRIRITCPFAERYQLGGEVALVGVRDRVEIWNRKEWERYYRESSRVLARIRSQLDF
jgi:MraZ protein